MSKENIKPCLVTSDKYRKNYDKIFKKEEPKLFECGCGNNIDLVINAEGTIFCKRCESEIILA